MVRGTGTDFGMRHVQAPSRYLPCHAFEALQIPALPCIRRPSGTFPAMHEMCLPRLASGVHPAMYLSCLPSHASDDAPAQLYIRYVYPPMRQMCACPAMHLLCLPSHASDDAPAQLYIRYVYPPVRQRCACPALH